MSFAELLSIELLTLFGLAWAGTVVARKLFGWTEPLRATSGLLGVIAGILLLVLSLIFILFLPYIIVGAVALRHPGALLLVVAFYLPPFVCFWGARRVQKHPVQGAALLALPVPICVVGVQWSLLYNGGAGTIFGPKVDFVLWSLALACLTFASTFGVLSAARRTGPVKLHHILLGLVALLCISLITFAATGPPRLVSGVVVKFRLGKDQPVARARIYVERKDGGWLADIDGWSHFEAYSDSNGRFLIYLRDGSYWVRVGTLKDVLTLDVDGDRDFTIRYP